jgi:DNA-binding GntR family transcriptional regulator
MVDWIQYAIWGKLVPGHCGRTAVVAGQVTGGASEEHVRIHKIDVGDAPSVADLIFDSLRRAVISGALKDGDPLRQEELARHFNASRIPVREALTRLEQHGLVQVRRFRGYTVAQMSRRQIEEICRFRALVEGEVVASAASLATDETLVLARRTCQAFAKEQDPVLWGERNREFHAALYADCGLPYHLEAVHAALDKTERYLVDQLVLTSGMRRARAEHKAILAAFEARDASLAERLTREHILGALSLFCEYMDSRAVPQRAVRGRVNPDPTRTGRPDRKPGSRRA